MQKYPERIGRGKEEEGEEFLVLSSCRAFLASFVIALRLFYLLECRSPFSVSVLKRKGKLNDMDVSFCGWGKRRCVLLFLLSCPSLFFPFSLSVFGVGVSLFPLPSFFHTVNRRSLNLEDLTGLLLFSLSAQPHTDAAPVS